MWGSTFADLAKRATELQEQASHLSVAQSLFNLDGLQPGKSGDEQDHSKPTTSATDDAAPTTTTETQKAAAEKQESTTISSLIPTTTLYAEDKLVGSLVIPENAAAVETAANSNFGSNETIHAEENKVGDAVSASVANTSGKDGWDEEDAEEFDFDSSPSADPEPVFDDSNKEEIMDSMLSNESNKEEIVESILSQQEQPPVDALPPDNIPEEQVNEPSIVSKEPTPVEVDAPKQELVPIVTSPVGGNEEPTVKDSPTEEIKNVEENDDEVVFSDEDDGLEDMYDDDDDVNEEDDKVIKENGAEILEQEEEIADLKDESPNDEALSPEVTNQQTSMTAVEEPTEETVALQDNVEKSVLNESQSNSGATPNEADESPPRMTSEEKVPTATAEVESSSPSDESVAREAVEQEKASELGPAEFQQTPTSVGEDMSVTVEPTVEDKPAPASESTESAPIVEAAPSERALPELPAAPMPDNRVSAQVDNSMADRLLEQFSQQMQRLDENHQAELRERDQQHALELEKALASFNHDQCEEQRRDMEERLLEKLRIKEEQLMEVLKTNEGHKLKIDVLKRELDGTRQLLAEKESAVGSVHAARESDIRDLERKLNQKDAEIAATKERYEKLSAELKEVKDELETTNDSFSTLKGRVKVVATELKDRRVECRNLGIEVAELTESNEGLKTQLANLQSQLADQNRSQSEKDDELEQLRTNLATMEDRLKVAEKSIKEAGSVNEKTLASYKKKAQAALAEANARSAAASQAREEAELEARAARSTADAAMERARVAEAAGKEALAEAKSYVKDLEEEKSRFEEEAQEMQQTLTSTVEQLNQVRAELAESRAAQDKLSRDLEQMCRNLEAERAKSQELEEDLSDSRRRANELHDQLETFREELLQRSSTASFGAGTYSDTSGVAGKAVLESGSHLNLTVGPNKPTDKSDAEATIIILQQELHDANKAIRELKDTLRVTIEQQAEHAHTTPVVAPPQKSNGFHQDSSAQGNDSTPLYYAMEKQAELNLARDEINRLANLLGDAESSKMEAYEAMDEMRRKMEEAQSRLKRFEKMGSAAGRGTSSRMSNQSISSRDGNHFGEAETSPSQESTHDEAVVDSAVVNLEYLKNVMLSYLNAKTLQEKKSLVPVIGAVLCLTAEEQTKALKTIEDTGGIEGVGQALLETFGSGRLF